MNEAVRARFVRAGTRSAAIDYAVSEADRGPIESELAGRIARFLPKLARSECGLAAAHVCAGLLALIRQEAERVQRLMAEVVRPIPHAALEQAIAAVEVADRLLPLLSDADLLFFLATPPPAQPHADRPVLQALLAHGSVCVQEATLDAMVGAKPQSDLGHPTLSGEAGRHVREIAAEHALAVLAASADVSAQLCSQMVSRIGRVRSDPEGNETLLATIRVLKTANALPETTLLEAAEQGQTSRFAAILAVASGVPLDAVDRAWGLRNAKALVALAWKAGFTMRSALVAQTVLGQLSPSNTPVPRRARQLSARTRGDGVADRTALRAKPLRVQASRLTQRFPWPASPTNPAARAGRSGCVGGLDGCPAKG